MGYVHNVAMSQFVSPTMISASAGTWTLAVASNVWSLDRTAVDASFTIYIPVPILSSPVALKGSYLKSIEAMYSIATTTPDDFAYVRLYKDTLAASAASGSGSINTDTLLATTIDVHHDTTVERKWKDEHRMTVTLDTPAWIDNDETYHLELVIDAAAGSVVKIFGANINYTVRF